MEEVMFIFKTKKRYITEIMSIIILFITFYKNALTWNFFIAILIAYLFFSIFFIQQIILDNTSIYLNYSYLLFFKKSAVYKFSEIVKVRIGIARAGNIKFTLNKNSILISKSYQLLIRSKDLENVEKILKEHSVVIDDQLPSFLKRKDK